LLEVATEDLAIGEHSVTAFCEGRPVLDRSFDLFTGVSSSTLAEDTSPSSG
jgi:hypothetical protein